MQSCGQGAHTFPPWCPLSHRPHPWSSHCSQPAAYREAPGLCAVGPVPATRCSGHWLSRPLCEQRSFDSLAAAAPPYVKLGQEPLCWQGGAVSPFLLCGCCRGLSASTGGGGSLIALEADVSAAPPSPSYTPAPVMATHTSRVQVGLANFRASVLGIGRLKTRAQVRGERIGHPQVKAELRGPAGEWGEVGLPTMRGAEGAPAGEGERTGCPEVRKGGAPTGEEKEDGA